MNEFVSEQRHCISSQAIDSTKRSTPGFLFVLLPITTLNQSPERLRSAQSDPL
jgi:hypothetical protein